MDRRVIVAIGNAREVIPAKEVRFLEGDMVCIVSENEGNLITHKRNILIQEWPHQERVDRCVSCGSVVPEGRQICINCERGEDDDIG